jgi:hypothetical protein
MMSPAHRNGRILERLQVEDEAVQATVSRAVPRLNLLLSKITRTEWIKQGCIKTGLM